MRKSELIQKLSAIEGDPEVCLVNLAIDTDEQALVTSKFSVDLLANDKEESEEKEFIAIQYHAEEELVTRQ